MLVHIDNKLFCAICVLVMSSVVPAQARNSAARAKDLDIDKIEGWQVTAVELFTDYDKIQPHEPNVSHDGNNSAPPDRAADTSSPAEHIKLAQARLRQWSQAKPEALRVIAALCPTLKPLVDQVQVQPGTRPKLLTIAYGRQTQSPYIRMQFEIEDEGPRLVHVHILASVDGQKPAMDNRVGWELVARETLGMVFQRKLEERPRIRHMHNGYYFSWIPNWKSRQLPEHYWTTFAAIRYKGDWVIACTARATKQQTRHTIDQLNLYPINYEMRQAVIQVVKNAQTWYPDEFDGQAKVWAACQPVMTNAYDDRQVYLVYVDRPAIIEQAKRGQAVLSWHVRVVSDHHPLESVVGWVDPETGKLLHMGFRGPPKQ